MKFSVEVTGTYHYNVEVEAGSEAEAKQKAIADFYDYDSTYLEFDDPQADVWNVEQ